MFRYQFELSNCEWAEDKEKQQADETWFELRCHKRGARCCVNSLPAALTVRSAPETDTLFVSLLRKDTVLARSDDIDIGGITRRVGVRPIPLRAAGTGAVVCSLSLMWSVEEEDGSVFSRPVEDYVAFAEQSSTGALDTLGGNNNSGNREYDTSSSKEKVPLDLHDEGSVSIQRQQELKQMLSANGGEKKFQTSGKEKKGAMWCVDTLQYAPEGLLDYYTTSTQVVKQPEAWCNLYTSSAPLLVANGLHQEQQREVRTKRVTSRRYNSVFASSQPGYSSAIEEIRQQPTKAADISAEDLQHLLYIRKKNNLKWRTFISANDTYTTSSTRAR
ncbi:uncharacterized protein TM35_000171580 [Trypanosoma theileri]|uniref:Uncharacterized protein n=1 Tax=Trypanosoma theileri TaxID=67003 RepID=A0A1X0NUA1_9TRYP|nr:uncharacterized protein TM35_000171580 [Trypanosoma theileri]ORC88286.1 hypothetical protein TM35_000171580 [Trypanosoma theileri]